MRIDETVSCRTRDPRREVEREASSPISVTPGLLVGFGSAVRAVIGLAVVSSVISLESCGRLRQSKPGDAKADSPIGAGLASPSAFDLVEREGGAVLVWAPKERTRPALLASALDANGVLSGNPERLLERRDVKGDIAELVGVHANGSLGVAWLERSAGSVRLRAAQSLDGKALVPLELGASSAVGQGERSSLALVVDRARDGTLSLLARGPEAACVEDNRSHCSAFAWWRLANGKSESRGFSLSVPTPCRQHAVFLVSEPRGLHYAVCSQSSNDDASRITTLFTIQSQPEYARADTPLNGCNPLGLFELDSATWLIGDCGGQRRAARVGPENAAIELRELASPRLECVNGRARIHAGPFEFLLTEPRAGLAPLLPTSVAPRESRAVWSGSALLVASAPAAKLGLSRYACAGNSLRQLVN